MKPEQTAVISHAEMDAAYDTGDAVLLAPSVSWLVRYQDAWWVIYEGGWLRITDELTAGDIDNCAARISAEEEEPCRPPR
jgi:hypothetical protein